MKKNIQTRQLKCSLNAKKRPVSYYNRQKTRTYNLKSLTQDENGAATLEIVIIIAVLIAIALIFNTQLRNFATSLFNKVFDDNSVLDQIGTIGS